MYLPKSQPRISKLLRPYPSNPILPFLRSLLHSPRPEDLDILRRPVRLPRPDQPHPLHDPQPGLDPAENGVFAVQPGGWGEGDEELEKEKEGSLGEL
jgi:hypothetical protein